MINFHEGVREGSLRPSQRTYSLSLEGGHGSSNRSSWKDTEERSNSKQQEKRQGNLEPWIIRVCNSSGMVDRWGPITERSVLRKTEELWIGVNLPRKYGGYPG